MIGPARKMVENGRRLRKMVENDEMIEKIKNVGNGENRWEMMKIMKLIVYTGVGPAQENGGNGRSLRKIAENCRKL